MSRQLKKRMLELLKSEDFDKGLEEILQLPARQVINPLFSFLYNSDESVKQKAIKAMGAVVSSLAENDIEAARVIIRRLMWNLNDESGGIGWGSPEAMGEIMAKSKQLAEEYHSILISYIREDGNYIEHEILQRGVLWGLARLAQVRPDLVKDAAPFLHPYIESDDLILKEFASQIAKAILL